MRKLITFFILTLLATTATRAATVTDELTYQGIGISGTNYSNWSEISFTSSAVYAGNSAGGNNAIQLRSNNSNSGIVTTASGGKVKKITVEWNSNTQNGRTMNVYGKNTAYSAASDLYNTSNQGTLLGTIVKDATTELTVTGDYQYIGFRSASSALYLEKVSIEWEEGGSSTTTSNVFELVTDVTNLVSGDDIIVVAVDNIHAMGAVANKVGGSATGFTLSGTQVTLDANTDVVVYNLSGSNGSWALNNSNISIGASGPDLNNSGEAKWTITITDGVAKLVYNNESNRQLAYRLEGTSYNYFKHYASSNIDDEHYFNVKIYKRQTSTPSPDYPEVVGIAAFKQVESGTTVKLKLTDESNARVLHVENGTGGAVDAYVRDDSGALVLKGITPNRTMAYNQHLAGWIVGQYSVNATTGLPQLVPVNDTNTDELVIADPVTEAATLPVEIDAADMGDYVADWATVKNIRSGSGAPEITNTFNVSGYTAPYSGALVDVNGIVADGMIYPMTEESTYPLVTYVLDASQDFTSPSAAVENVPVRWQRAFVADQWTPITLPFSISDFDGVVMRYISLSDGGITTTSEGSYSTGQMNFSQVSSIEAGVPYLVKTDETFSSMILDDVTITTTPAQTLSYTTNGAVTGSGNGAPMRALASGDTYSMVGTYSPTTVEKANTNKLIVGGNVVWANDANGNTVEGSSAYITTPKNQAIKLNLGDEGIITGIDTIEATMLPVRIGTYNLLGIKLPDDWGALPPGIYIVNGKKVVKQ